MPEIGQIKVTQAGYTGAPGYSSFYFFGDPYSNATATSNVGDVRTFFETIAATMPSGWTYSIQPDVAVLDEASGALLRVISTTPAAQGTFGSATTYSAGVGAVAGWNTAAVHRTKRLRGRTFIVPLGSDGYDTTGTISSLSLGRLRNAATALAAVANFGVWGRPVAGAGGDWAACTGGTVRDHVAWLSSRRD